MDDLSRLSICIMREVANQSMPLEHCLLQFGSADVDSVDRWKLDVMGCGLQCRRLMRMTVYCNVDFMQRYLQAASGVTVYLVWRWTAG